MENTEYIVGTDSACFESLVDDTGVVRAGAGNPVTLEIIVSVDVLVFVLGLFFFPVGFDAATLLAERLPVSEREILRLGIVDIGSELVEHEIENRGGLSSACLELIYTFSMVV